MISRREKKRTWLWGSAGLALFLCLLSGCAGISPEPGSDLLWSGEAQSLQEASRDEQGSVAQEDDGQVQGIPFRQTPEIPEYVMPPEDYADPLDREASEIIDGAICKAIAAVSVMKDDRHSKVTYPHEEDPHGYTARFSEDQRGLYDYIVEKGRALEAFHVTNIRLAIWIQWHMGRGVEIPQIQGVSQIKINRTDRERGSVGYRSLFFCTYF